MAGPDETKNLAGKSPPPDSDPFRDGEFAKNLAYLSNKITTCAFLGASLVLRCLSIEEPLIASSNPGKVFRFTLEYTVIFEFRNGKVTDLNAKPEVVGKR